MWKTLVYEKIDYGQHFLISDSGDIYSLRTKKILKKYLNHEGYFQICVSLGSRSQRKVFKLHRAVAENFVPGKAESLVVNHIDGNKTNNKSTNLEWVTPETNTLHAMNKGLFTHGHKVRCIQTGVVFLSMREAGRWCGMETKAGSLQEYFKNPNRIHAGRHPITGEKLTWELVNE